MPLTFKLSLPVSTKTIKAISTDMPTDQPDADNHLSRLSPKRILQCVQSMIKTNHPYGLLLCSPRHQEEYSDPRVGTRKRVTIAAFWCTTASCGSTLKYGPREPEMLRVILPAVDRTGYEI